MKILIDNGHGKETPGKRSPDGKLREYLYTREIAEAIEKELKSLGIDAERIVPEMEDITLEERVRRVNAVCDKIGKENVIFLSIHCNAAGKGEWKSARGWSAYTTKGGTNSDNLATKLYAEAGKNFIGQTIRRDYSDGDPDWEENFYVLKRTKCVAVLTENFFMDNKQDIEYLLSEKGKQAIVKTHVDGIISYINDIKSI
jgi:N-acetylmuramoyl-L-alanine amidase|nr:MAG TPA_asm: Cell wall hydrolase autolysin [Caudoviricetes sp.]